MQALHHPTTSDPAHVTVYQNEAQLQQLINYKIPQLGNVMQQEQGFVVNKQAGQLVKEKPHRVQYRANRIYSRKA